LGGKKVNVRKLVLLALSIFLFLLFSGCNQSPRIIQDVHELDGTVIGCILGYSSDLILTKDYPNVELRRFDSYGDMMMALTFHQLDAAAMEMDEAYVFCRLQPEYMILGTFVEQDTFSYCLNPRTPAFNEQFNSFVAEFRKTPEYQDLLQRVKESAFHPFEAKAVSYEQTPGKVLRVSVYDGWEPVSYVNTSTNEWEGADIELITHFAKSMGARIEFVSLGSYTQAILDLSLGKVDIMVCPDTLRFKEDLEKAGNVTMSDGVWDKDIVIIVNTKEYEQ